MTQSIENLLPQDGTVYYYGKIFSLEEADRWYTHLLEGITWQHDEAKIFGKTYITKRKVAWYAEQPFPYRYSGATKIALPWTPELVELNTKVEEVSGETFNSCLLNLYHSGEEGMAWHSDGEKELRKNGAIASISLGAERKFSFKHKQTKERNEIWLEHGSLLMMQGETQTHWLHRLPPTKRVNQPRINLTFRQIVGQPIY
jgi:alkylated DNA repair dioxygenase AlkB